MNDKKKHSLSYNLHFFHHITLRDGALRMTLKRVNLLNCDAALPAVQLFI